MSAEAWRRTGSNWRRCILRGRRDAFSTSGSLCVAGVALSVPSCPRKLGDELGRIGAAAFYVAGVTPSAPQARFAWQAWHFQYLHVRGSSATNWVEWRRCILRGRRHTFSTSGSICVAGVALSVPSYHEELAILIFGCRLDISKEIHWLMTHLMALETS